MKFDIFAPEYVALAGLVVSTIALGALAILTVLRRRQMEASLKIAHLSVEREYFERSLRDLTERMSKDQGRWADLNHLILDSMRAQAVVPERRLSQPDELGPQTFLKSLGVNIDQLTMRADQVFVLTPFSSVYQDEYRQIAEACSDVGLIPRRGDEVRIAGSILPHIVKGIATSRFVIANISGRNPNVFYELGIAQAMGKPAIIVSRDFSTVPFDLRQQQLVLFDNREEIKGKLKEAMLRLFAELGQATPIDS